MVVTITTYIERDLLDEVPYNFSEHCRRALDFQIYKLLKDRNIDFKERFENNLELFNLTKDQKKLLKFMYGKRKVTEYNMKIGLNWNCIKLWRIGQELVNLKILKYWGKQKKYDTTSIFDSLITIDFSEEI